MYSCGTSSAFTVTRKLRAWSDAVRLSQSVSTPCIRLMPCISRPQVRHYLVHPSVPYVTADGLVKRAEIRLTTSRYPPDSPVDPPIGSSTA